MSFPLGRAMICAALDCAVVFDIRIHRACPACASAEIYPVENFLSKRSACAYERGTVAELERLHVLKTA